jgi:hypothetical protein
MQEHTTALNYKTQCRKVRVLFKTRAKRQQQQVINRMQLHVVIYALLAQVPTGLTVLRSEQDLEHSVALAHGALEVAELEARRVLQENHVVVTGGDVGQPGVEGRHAAVCHVLMFAHARPRKARWATEVHREWLAVSLCVGRRLPNHRALA